MLVGHGEGVVYGAHFLHAFEFLGESFVIVVQDDHAFAGIVAWSPIIIILVTGDGGRQSHFRTEEIDSSRLAVVLTEDGASFLIRGRKFEIGVRDDLGHLFPAKLVGIKLWERPLSMIFDFR